MRILTILSLLLALTACGLGQYVPPLVTDTPLPSSTPNRPDAEAPTPTPPSLATTTSTAPAILTTAVVIETCTVATGIAGGHLNLRSCAGMDCPIIAWLAEGTTLQVHSTTADGWLEVQAAGDIAGWVNGAFCRRAP